MKLAINNNTMRLLETNGKTEFTIDFKPETFCIYTGFVPKLINRIYITTDENGYIDDDLLLEIFKGRNMEGEFSCHPPLKVHNTECHMSVDKVPSSQHIHESHLFLQRDELFHNNVNVYKTML